MLPPDAETRQIAGHLIAFLDREVRAGRLSPSLQPLQAGIGTISNAVLHGLIDSPFSDLKMYSEVLQDSTIELLDAGRLSFASASSVTLSRDVYARFLSRLDHYRSRVLLRPQEISNHPEVIRRLGLITINTALECDIYGNVNSTHVLGTHMMNGGGSGDFARNAHLSVFVTKSIAKGGNISSVVPMVAHVDHTEHDVDIIVTEHGPRTCVVLRRASARGRSSTTVPTRSIAMPCATTSRAPACVAARRRICWKRHSHGTCAIATTVRCARMVRWLLPCKERARLRVSAGRARATVAAGRGRDRRAAGLAPAAPVLTASGAVGVGVELAGLGAVGVRVGLAGLGAIGIGSNLPALAPSVYGSALPAAGFRLASVDFLRAPSLYGSNLPLRAAEPVGSVFFFCALCAPPYRSPPSV